MANYEIIECAYLPPRGGKYQWHPPVLRRQPWYAVINPTGWHGHRLALSVHNTTRGYIGRVDHQPLMGSFEKHGLPRFYKNPLRAILAVERYAEKLIEAERLPSWVPEALEAGWRPPRLT